MYEYSDDATLFAGLFKCQRVFPAFFFAVSGVYVFVVQVLYMTLRV